MKKYTLFLFSIFGLLAIANENTQLEECSDTSAQSSSCENLCDTCSRTKLTPYESIQGKEVLPSYGVERQKDALAKPYFIAEYILWDVYQGGLEYALSGFSASNNAESNTTVRQGQIYAPDAKLKSGFKAGVGFDFCYDNWDLSLVYTWFKSSSCSVLQGALSPDYYEVPYDFENQNIKISSDVRDQRVTSGDSIFKLFFNVVDLTLGKSFFISPKIILNPYFGLKGSYQSEHNNLNFLINGQASGIGPKSLSYPNATGYYTALKKQTYGGIGPKIACYALWSLSKNFGVFADAGLSNMWSWYKSYRTDSVDILNNITQKYLVEDLQYANVTRKNNTLNQVFETRLGLSYNIFFCDNTCRLISELGWEGQLWFNQNQLPSLILATGNLSLQGLNISFRLDF